MEWVDIAAGDYASSTAIKVIGEQFMKLDRTDLKDEEDWTEWLKKQSIMSIDFFIIMQTKMRIKRDGDDS